MTARTVFEHTKSCALSGLPPNLSYVSRKNDLTVCCATRWISFMLNSTLSVPNSSKRR